MRMKLKQRQHSADSLFSMALLLIFTVFTLMLGGMGAAVYKNSVAHLNENYTSRTAIAYISEKIRQYNSSDSIFLSSVGGSDALVLKDTTEDEVFLTYIYYYDGALRELFVRQETLPDAATGNAVVELAGLEIKHAEDAGVPGNALGGSSLMPADDASGGSSLMPADNASGGSLIQVTAVSPEGNELSILLHCCKVLS